jgi:hypothetical protein
MKQTPLRTGVGLAMIVLAIVFISNGLEELCGVAFASIATGVMIAVFGLALLTSRE